jgi:GT2 family glycosyltransferase
MTTDATAQDPGAPSSADESFFGDDEYVEAAGPDTSTYDRHQVTAVLVAHQGARWLPYTLAALERLTRPPQRTYAVDTGSTDGSRELLVEDYGEASVLSAPVGTGFGGAVGYAVAALRGQPGLPSPVDDDRPVVEWLWLLHDDCAPEPETLRRLLAVADASPSVAVLGPKVRGWHDSSRLVEVGVSIGGGGRRETGLDRGELDQGQHDGRSDVLAVGSAGMLVRRDIFDQLGGFDPALPLFRDDVDLGWRANLAGHRVVVVPDAVLHHVEAAAHGRRDIAAARGGAHRVDRRSAVHVLLANSSAVGLPWHWVRLLVGTVLRTLTLLVGKAPGEAWAELSGGLAGLLGVPSLVRSRRARRGTRTVHYREVRHLLPSWTTGLRHGIDALGGLVSGRSEITTSPGSGIESGPTSEEAESLVAGPSRLRLLLRRPGVRLTLLLVLLALVTFRGLLGGDGLLQGGALLPGSGPASALWRAYGAGWHDVGVGSAIPTSPYLVPMAALASVLAGKTWLAVELVLVLAVPLAGMVAYVLLGRLVTRTWLRLTGAVTYALLPAVTGAVAGGRLGTAVAAWLLPLAFWVAGRGVGIGGHPSWRRTWVGSLLLAVTVAFAPTAWPMAVAAGLLGVLLWAPASVWTWLRLVAVLAVPPLLLMPWTQHLLHDPAAWLIEAGTPAPALADPNLPPWHVLVANPGGPGVPWVWLTIPLLVAGLAALLRADRRRPVLTCWAVALSGVAVGLATAGRTVVPDSLGTRVPVWPGTATLVVGLGLVAAAAVGVDEVRVRLSAHGFGWRQPATAVLVAVSLVVPVVLVGGWVARGASDVLVQAPGDILPAYVKAASEVPSRPRSLVLELRDGVTTFALVPGEGRRIGDGEVAPPASATVGLTDPVSALVDGVADLAQVQVIATYAVGFVVVGAPVPPAVQRALDSTPGLSRVSAGDTGSVWRVDQPSARVTLLRPPAPTVAVAANPTDPTTTVDTTVPPPVPPASSALLRVAEAADPGWTATADGRAAPGRALGWQQVFDVPVDATRITLTHDSSRKSWLVFQAVLLGVVVLLALPSRRRSDDDGDDADLPDADLVVVAEAPGHPVPAGDR